MTVQTPPTTASAVPSPAEQLKAACGSIVHVPGSTAYDEARVPWNVAVDQRPAAVAVPRTAQDLADVVRAAARPRPPGRPAGHRPRRGLSHRARPLASGARPDHRVPGRHGGPRPAGRPGGQRRPVAGRRRSGGTARPRRAARLVPGRGGRRLRARRRHRLVRAQARPGHEQPRRRRAGRRRRNARARGRDRAPRPVLGRARRWRKLRRGDRARAAALPDRRRLRRDAGVGPRARRRGAAVLGDVVRRGARRGHHLVAVHALPTPARAARLPARAPVGHRGRCRARRRRAGAGADRAPARSRPRDGHLRPHAGAGPGAPAHGPRGPDPVGRREPVARRPGRGHGGGVPRRRRTAVPDHPAALGAAAARRCARPSRTGGRRAGPYRRGLRRVLRRDRRRPGAGGCGSRRHRTRPRRAGAARHGRELPEPGRARGRPCDRLPGPGVAATARRCAPRTTPARSSSRTIPWSDVRPLPAAPATRVLELRGLLWEVAHALPRSR